MLSGQNILVLSPSEWKDNAVSNMHISAILSEQNKVLYVETIGGRLPRIREIRRVFERLKRILRGAKNREKTGLDPKNVVILSPFAIPMHNSRIISWINRRVLLFQIKRLMRKLGMTRPIIWSFSPRWEPVAQGIPHSCYVFHCVDDLKTYQGTGSEIFQQLYNETIKHADIIFVPGKLLFDEMSQGNSKTFRIRHGCSIEHLERKDEKSDAMPDDAAGLPAPRVIYAGTLANWVDYELLTRTAELLPNISFLLVGYIHALAPVDKVKALLSLPNVYHLGYRDFSRLPAYYAASSAGIIPYQAGNKHIQHSSPTKIYDYLAAGLPCVSTAFPAAKEMGDWITLSENAKTFAECILKEIHEDSHAKSSSRIYYARQNTWGNRLEEMSSLIKTSIEKKQSA